MFCSPYKLPAHLEAMNFLTNIIDAESDESLEIPSLVETEQIVEYSELGFFALEDFVKSLYQKQVSLP